MEGTITSPPIRNSNMSNLREYLLDKVNNACDQVRDGMTQKELGELIQFYMDGSSDVEWEGFSVLDLQVIIRLFRDMKVVRDIR